MRRRAHARPRTLQRRFLCYILVVTALCCVVTMVEFERSRSGAVPASNLGRDALASAGAAGGSPPTDDVGAKAHANVPSHVESSPTTTARGGVSSPASAPDSGAEEEEEDPFNPHWDFSWGSPYDFTTPAYTEADIDKCLSVRGVSRREMLDHDVARKQMFQEVYDSGKWVNGKGGQSVPKSGSGSTLPMTELVREAIKEAVLKYKVRTFMDAPCGDLTWMKELFPFFDEHGVKYTGVDIVQSEIERHRIEHPTRKFIQCDMSVETLPRADMIFSREALQHTNAEDNLRTLNRWKLSGSKYLLQTNYIVNMGSDRWLAPKHSGWLELGSMNYREMNNGEAALIEFLKPPYNFPPPLDKWVDKRHTVEAEQYVSLWVLAEEIFAIRGSSS